MQPFPHTYRVEAGGVGAGVVKVSAEGLSDLLTTSPREFDGPGDQWSPESLLAAAVASCFILTFRAVARASKLEWTHLECEVDAVLERIEGVTQFTRIQTTARLTAAATATEELCQRALEKAERNCLIANSLRATRELKTQIVRQ